jgi:mycothiol system anti-sigma-R factor
MEMEHGYGHRSGDGAAGGGFDCEEAIHTLYSFLDGELTIERRLEIQQHLDECSPCLEAFDFEAELRIVIARKCRDKVPPSLLDRVSQALAEASGSGVGAEDTGGMSTL